MTLTVGSLFSGIGGIELGLERTGGFETRWQVENDPYAQAVLRKHWPDVGRWDDVRTFPPGEGHDRYGEFSVDLICGGFPCQDISNAGKQAGIDGERSGLWREYIRIVRVLRPRYVVVENVAALLGRGLGRVLGDLAESGYDAEWEVLPAAAFGASHIRERVFVVAYSSKERLSAHLLETREGFCCRDVSTGWRWNVQSERLGRGVGNPQFPPPPKHDEWSREPQTTYNSPCAERGVCGAAHGISGGMDRIACLGNAVVPQVAQWLGERILTADSIR